MYRLLSALLFLLPLTANAKNNIDTHLVNEMLTTVNRQYIEPVDNAELILAGMQAVSDLDNKFTFSKGRDRFYIYYNRVVNRAIPFPENSDDVLAWIEALSKLLNAATEISPAADIKDFELPDRVMKKMTAKLDEYSHYYSEYDYDEDAHKNEIYTLFKDRLIDDVLYLKVRTFNKQTGESVKKALENNPDVKGVVLDLRGNSGGMFNEALKVANLFCDNEIITYTAGRNNADIHYYTSKESPLYTGPLVIMIDGDTASAAEVLAGGLQEQSRAKLIGAHSFGKGTIQSVTQMSNGGRLVLTTEQFFTPSGKVIHKKGIEPDVCLSGKTADGCYNEKRVDKEEDIDEAIKLLKGKL